MKLLSLSLVLYNNKLSDLEKLMESMAKATIPYTFFVVDNSPTRQLESFFKDYPVEYIFIGKNKGYGAGHNVGIRKALGNFKYHIVINPDIYFDAQVLEPMIEYMDANQDVGHLMPKILYPNGDTQFVCRRFPTPFDLIANRFLPKKMTEKRRAHFEMQDMGYDKITEGEFLSGCFMLFRTKALEEVGIFDEKIFMYYEDLDISKRVSEKYKLIFYPEVEVYHGYNKGSARNLRLLIAHIRSAIYYFNKYGWFPFA